MSGAVSAGETSEEVMPSAPYGGIQRRDGPSEKSGVLHFIIGASQSLESGAVPSGSGTPETSTVSEALSYTSSLARNQFEMTDNGGAVWTNQGGGSNIFENLEVMDTLRVRRMTLMVSDSASYLPQSPTVGNSGIPGVGDLNGTVGFGTLAPTIAPSQTIISDNSQRLSNVIAGSMTINMTGRTAITAMGSYGILRFVDADVLDSQQETAGLTISHRYSARNTVGVRYTLARFGYNDPPATLDSQEVSLSYERRWSRRWKSDFEIGPQWVSEGSMLPVSLNIAGNASINYNHGVSSLDLEYTRGVAGGSGVVQGTRVDSVSLAAVRSFGRSWSVGVSGAYSRNVELIQDEVFTSKYAGAQITHRIGRWSGYFSYTAIEQSSPAIATAAPISVLQGLYHTFSVGIQYTSRPIRVRGL